MAALMAGGEVALLVALVLDVLVPPFCPPSTPWAAPLLPAPPVIARPKDAILQPVFRSSASRESMSAVIDCCLSLLVYHDFYDSRQQP
jgi:hypothetical protein